MTPEKEENQSLPIPQIILAIGIYVAVASPGVAKIKIKIEDSGNVHIRQCCILFA